MYNKVLLLGYVGKEVESKDINGRELHEFPLATSKSWKDKNDEWQEKTEWHLIKHWGKLNKNVDKGALVFIEGEIATESWEDSKTNEKRYKTVINSRYIKVPPRGDSPVTDNTQQFNGEDLPF